MTLTEINAHIAVVRATYDQFFYMDAQINILDHLDVAIDVMREAKESLRLCDLTTAQECVESAKNEYMKMKQFARTSLDIDDYTRQYTMALSDWLYNALERGKER